MFCQDETNMYVLEIKQYNANMSFLFYYLTIQYSGCWCITSEETVRFRIYIMTIILYTYQCYKPT